MNSWRRKRNKLFYEKEKFILNKKTIKSNHFVEQNNFDNIFSLKEDKYNDVMEGDLVYMKMVNILTDTINFTLYPVQLWALKLALVCALPKIYEKDWDTRYKEILKKHGVTNVYQIYCLTAPRRTGKTIMLAILNLAFLFSIKSTQTDKTIVRQIAKFLDQSYAVIDESIDKIPNIPNENWKMFDFFYRVGFLKIVNKNDHNDRRFYVATATKGEVSKKIKKVVVVVVKIKINCDFFLFFIKKFFFFYPGNIKNLKFTSKLMLKVALPG